MYACRHPRRTCRASSGLPTRSHTKSQSCQSQSWWEKCCPASPDNATMVACAPSLTVKVATLLLLASLMLKLLVLSFESESAVGAAKTPPDLLTRGISSVCQAASLIGPVWLPVGNIAVAVALVNITVLKSASRPVLSSIHSAELRMGFVLTMSIVNGSPRVTSSRDNS